MRNEDVFEAVAEALKRGEPAALVTIIRAQGSTPQRVGAKMLVFPDGRTVGTIGGGCYENEAFWKARTAIETRQPVIAKYELADDIAEESGLICGGQMEVYIEPLEPAPELYLVGAGHVSFHLARAAHEVGFKLHIIDDRQKFANAERFPDAEEVVVDSIPDWLANAELPAHAFAVILTRGHRHDLDALRALAPKPIRYLGLIGSRAKVVRLTEALASEGISTEQLQRVHSPVGLDLGAITPQEIAISILAEMIGVKYGKIDPNADQDTERVTRSLSWTPRSQTEATVGS
jgi:xanthine dehydrogenase accessory factor